MTPLDHLSRVRHIFLLCLLSLALSENISAKQLVIKGTPVVNIASNGDQTNRTELTEGQDHQFTLLITKDDSGRYLWESREGKELIRTDQGVFTHFLSPGSGWIKIGKTSELLSILEKAKAAGIGEDGLLQLLSNNQLSDWMFEHEFFYFEMITQGMFVGLYYGYADEFDPG